jgi:2-polyprenyl-6-methoxyphenol hydroxylase-like FAD-dependent oxidoreductase
MIASVLAQELALDENGVHFKYDPIGKHVVIIFPLGGGRFRIYLMYRGDGTRRGLSGPENVTKFIAACVAAGTPAAWYADASPCGPLAEFSGASTWITRPYHNGVVLVGDAGGASDPSWGCGLSLTLRDARVLSQALLAHDNWEEAAQLYAEQRERYFDDLHRIEGWYTMLLFDSGVEADERRARTLGKARGNIPDIVGLGPDSPCDEAARRRFFGEE